MFNILIVDDEKLIRKGLIALLPWSKFEMQVIGEANNGKAALEFMKENAVDFLFVDLTMPVMDGFELMRNVRLLYPDVWIVVLTCHQDFDYVQEALRLGAIDYIIKTQFDQDKVDDIFIRILERVTYEKKVRAPLTNLRSGYVLVHLANKRNHEQIINKIQDIDASIVEISDHSWFVSIESELTLSMLNEQLPREDWVIISIMNSPFSSQTALYEHLRREIPSYLFYEYKPDQYYYELSGLAKNDREAEAQRVEEIREALHSQKWMTDTAKFDSIATMVSSSRIDIDELAGILHVCLLPWVTIVGDENNPMIRNNAGATWHQWLQKLYLLRECVQLRMKQIPYSPTIITTIARALILIEEDVEFSLGRDELATKLLMSNSYFSQCFKDILGIAYGDHMKLRKMTKTAVLLEQSNEPIYQIALQSGFKDEKYFSKMFRSHFGLNPTEYRKKVKNGANDI